MIWKYVDLMRCCLWLLLVLLVYVKYCELIKFVVGSRSLLCEIGVDWELEVIDIVDIFCC